MASPELENYIKESRSAGASDDEIRQALSAQGWSAADISQAFDASAPAAAGTSPKVPAAGSTTGALSMKAIAGAILALVVVAAGGYLIFTKKPSPGVDDKAKSNQEISNVPFSCQELLPDAEFEAATGKKISEYTLKETGDSGLGCHYQGAGEAVSFGVVSAGSAGAAALVEQMAQAVNPNKDKPLSKITDVGQFAYHMDSGSLEIASTNDLYTITVAKDSNLEVQKRIGKTVDFHLQ